MSRKRKYELTECEGVRHTETETVEEERDSATKVVVRKGKDTWGFGFVRDDATNKVRLR